jgi:hypothetical protein
LVKITRKELIEKRLNVCRRILRLDTQRIRFELVTKLRDIFNAAHALAQNRDLDLRERQKWARVAAYAAQTIDSLCVKFDEKQIDKDLAELERLVNEVRAKTKSRSAEAEVSVNKESGDSSRSS